MTVRSHLSLSNLPRSFALATGFGLALIGCGLFAASPAHAQFVCDSTTPGGADGATATAAGTVACGTNATASGVGAMAIGKDSLAMGNFSTALGTGTQATDNGSTAVGNSSTSSGAGSTALGTTSQATGTFSTAIGRSAMSTGANSVAVGRNARALANGATALGESSRADGINSIAIGQGADTVGNANSIAIGNGVSTDAPNQVAIGTTTNTYRLAGITSAASTAAQTGPLSVVTTDANGHLAAVDLASLGLGSSVSTINSRLDEHDRKISKNTEGVAIALAMAGVPTLTANETFAMSANWGTFEGENGFAGGAAVRLDKNVQLNGGVGFGNDTVGGRAGVRIGW